MSKTRKFEHAGIAYEVRAAQFDHGWTARVFRNDAPVGPEYTARRDIAADFEHQHWSPVVEALMDLAQEDLTSGRRAEVAAADAEK